MSPEELESVAGSLLRYRSSVVTNIEISSVEVDNKNKALKVRFKRYVAHWVGNGFATHVEDWRSYFTIDDLIESSGYTKGIADLAGALYAALEEPQDEGRTSIDGEEWILTFVNA